MSVKSRSQMPSQGKDVKLHRLWAGVEYKKRRISKRRICLVLKRSVDIGNLFVLEVEFPSCAGHLFVWNAANQINNIFQFLHLMKSFSRFMVL